MITITLKLEQFKELYQELSSICDNVDELNSGLDTEQIKFYTASSRSTICNQCKVSSSNSIKSVNLDLINLLAPEFFF